MGSRAGIFDELQFAPSNLAEVEELWRHAMGSAEAAIICRDWAAALERVSEASQLVDISLGIEGACLASWRRRGSASLSLFTLVLRKLQQEKKHAEARHDRNRSQLH